MNVQEKISYWINTAESDLNTAEHMYTAGDFHWCLFLGHLVLEKILKAHYCLVNEDTPPRIHDLVKLSKLSDIKLNEEQLIFYNKVNDFNIETRYPDEKMSFYKMATKEFTEEKF